MKRDLKTVVLTALLAAGLLGGVQYAARLLPAWAVQNELVPPTTGTYTGVQFSQLLGDAFRSLASCNSGATAPANVGGAAVEGLCWIDTSVTPHLKKRYTGTDWIVEGAIDVSNGLWVAPIGGGTASIASASTTNLGSVPQANLTITGTTTIASFGSAAPTGDVKIIRFASALTLTHSANLKVPGGYDLTTAADDRAIVTHLGVGAWEITQYTRASGVPVDVSAVGDVKFTMAASAPAGHVLGYGQALTRTSYPAYLAKVTRAQNGTRTSGNATLTSVADTSGMGAGMPIEGTGIPDGTTISSVTSSTIVMSANATSSGTSTATAFFTGYGSGGSATTVGVPDCAGRMIASRDDISGSAASRITSAGSSIVGTQKNAAGGAQTVALTQSNLPNVSFAVTIPAGQGSHTHNSSSNIAAVTGGDDWGGAAPANQHAATSGIISAATLPAMSGTAASGGSDAANNKMPPTLIADCVVRVIP